jgi:uncharacterized membrane protein YeaQ/YmgE (transglycosylase-associated protein family)
MQVRYYTHEYRVSYTLVDFWTDMPLTAVLVVLAALVIISIVISVSIWITFGLIGLALHLLMAGLIGWLADVVVPGTLPWGWLGAILAGLVGSWLGVRLIGQIGPDPFGIPIIPGFVGAVILAVVISLLGKALGRSQASSI